MKEVVINSCFGGFGLSPDAVKMYAKLKGFNIYPYVTDYKSKDFKKTIRWNDGDGCLCIFYLKQDVGDNPTGKELNKAEWLHERDIPRDDADLVKVVKTLKDKANTKFSNLKIVKIPNDVEFVIEEYDGNEHIAEKHKTWA